MSAVLQVCLGCKAADSVQRRDGIGGGPALALWASDLTSRHSPGALRVETFPCLGRCTRRGRLSLAARGRWSWLFEAIDPDRDGDALALFIQARLDQPDGFVAKDDRPSSLRRRMLGRVPPVTAVAPPDP